MDLAKIVSAAVRNAQPLLARKRHHAELELPVGEVILQAHPVRLEQIVTNLLLNSAHYTNPGGRICISVETEEDFVSLTVCDNGEGIPRECMPNVFEPYWKGPASSGVGMGLSLVESLVKLHGGSIAAYSEGVGKGSQFSIRLPLNPKT